MRRILAGIAAAVCVSTAHANLIVNASNEEALVGDEIPGWTEVAGTGWTQRSSNPSAYDGTHYFFAGVVANATLRQIVDVSSFAGAIDASAQAFEFSGYVRAFAQSPVDSSRIVLNYLAEDQSVLATFDSGEIRTTDDWQLVADARTAPVLTRSIQIDLIARRYVGNNNDGYFDALSLVAAPVPEPAQYLMLALGMSVVAASALRRKR